MNYGLLLLATLVALRAEPEFVGVFEERHQESFALQLQRGGAVRWFRIGEAFDGFTIAEYRPISDQLILRRGSTTIALSLRRAEVKALKFGKDEILAAAVREVARRENWGDAVHFQGPHLFKGNWIVVARHNADARTIEARVIAATPSGFLFSYESL